MSKEKVPDRHTEPEMVVYPIRVPLAHMEVVRRIAKRRDTTRQSIVREALRLWVERNDV